MQGTTLLMLSALASTEMVGLGNMILDWFDRIGTAFIDMVTAIPNAVADLFSQWGQTIGQTWYGPILAAIAIIAVFLIMYAGFWIQDVFLE